MTYNDIKQRVYDILDMPIAEVTRVGYSKKIHRAFNEATFRIAHSVLPNLREYTIALTADKLPAKVVMPPDFISFAEDQNAYCNDKNFILTKFVGYNGIIFDGTEGTGTPYKYTIDAEEINTKLYIYKIYYNALYPEIIDGGQNYKVCQLLNTAVNADAYEVIKEPTETNHNRDTSYDWPQLIGQLAPHYVVSQLLSNDDKTRSITEMNNFETLLATVNVDRNERQREYRSVRGWY